MLNRSKAANSGFSLIELMVVMVIAALLFGLALPAYNGYMQKTRRTDAKVALSSMASQQERYFLKNNQYAGSTTALGYSANPHISNEGYYSIVVVSTDGLCGTAGTCYEITATGIGAQADDSDCATFTLTDTGAKKAYKSESTENSACW